MARTVAYSRSGLNGYELRDHVSQQRLRPLGGYFENFYSSVSRISEEIFFQQAVYFSYTLQVELSGYSREVDCISGQKGGHVDFIAVPEPSATLAKLTMLTFWVGLAQRDKILRPAPTFVRSSPLS